MIGQIVHEGLDQEIRGEVEDQTKGDGDGESWKSLLKDGEEQQSQTQTLETDGTDGGTMRVTCEFIKFKTCM